MPRADWEEQIIKTGYRELAKRAHPDKGGSDRDFDDLTEAYDALRKRGPSSVKDSDKQVLNLQLEMSHVSALLAGQPVVWKENENGLQVHVTLAGGPGGLLIDVISNLLKGTKFGKRGR